MPVDGWPLSSDDLPPLSAHIGTQLSEIGEELGRRIEELGRETAATIRSSVSFYREVSAVSDDALLTSCTENLRFFCASLRGGESLDTSAAVKIGTRRAAEGVPLPALMDAYRVGLHHIWQAISEIADRPGSGVDRGTLAAATERVWQAQDLFTTTMAGAYRQQAMQEVLEDEAERAALTEALLEGRIFADRTVWDIAQLLRIPQRGPYVVVAAQVPTVGKQPLRGIASMLSSVDVSSAWRLLPDLQIGIAYIASKTTRDALLDLLRRVATTPVGISPPFHNLTETAQALRYARFALNARNPSGAQVVEFDDSVLGIAAVSAPEVTAKIETIVFAGFEDLSAEEKNALFTTFQTWVDHAGSVPNTAEALYCHPNTVRHRLRRIEQVSGRSLKVPRDLAELCLAIEVHQRLPRQHDEQ
jgi:hypothetical protein